MPKVDFMPGALGQFVKRDPIGQIIPQRTNPTAIGKNCKVINKIEDLKNDALIKIRDKYYEKYLKTVGFCKKEDIQRLSNEILGKAKSETSKVNVDMNISKENVISLMIADIKSKNDKSSLLYTHMEKSYMLQSLTDSLSVMENELIKHRPGSPEWLQIKSTITSGQNGADKLKSMIQNLNNNAFEFKNEVLLRPIRLRNSVIWVKGTEAEVEKVQNDIYAAGENYWSKMVEETSPFLEKDFQEQLYVEPYQKLYNDIKKIPGNMTDSRKKVTDILAKEFRGVLVDGEKTKKGKFNPGYRELFRKKFQKTNEISQKIFTLIAKRDEYEFGSKDWKFFDKAIKDLVKEREKCIERNRAYMVNNDELDLGLYFQWIESNRYNLTPVAFYRIKRAKALDELNKMQNSTWTSAKSKRKFLEKELQQIENEWKETRKENLKILDENNVKDTSKFKKDFLCESVQ